MASRLRPPEPSVRTEGGTDTESLRRDHGHCAALYADVLAKILACLELPIEPPRMRSARAPQGLVDPEVGDLVEVEWNG